MVYLREGWLLRFDVSIISKSRLFDKLYFHYFEEKNTELSTPEVFI